eukprot:5637819-Pleurochrysis_carterae.AAC.1
MGACGRGCLSEAGLAMAAVERAVVAVAVSGSVALSAARVERGLRKHRKAPGGMVMFEVGMAVEGGGVQISLKENAAVARGCRALRENRVQMRVALR